MTKLYNVYILLAISLIVGLSSCGKPPIPPNPPLNPHPRTILAYFAGDNSLSWEVAQKTDSLVAGWNPSYGNLLIVADTERSIAPVLLQAKMKNGKAVVDTLKRYTNDNMASPELLRQAINDMKNIAPAESYGMILFSHATGWLPQGAFSNPLGWRLLSAITVRSVFVDQGREMTLADFSSAIPDNTFKFIAMDMCFMSSAETAYALRNKTEYMVVSAAEILSPGFFPIYKYYLKGLYVPEPDLTGFANAFYQYFNNKQGDWHSATISVLKTKEIEGIAALTKELLPNLTQAQIDQLQYYDRNGAPHLFFDLGDYMLAAAKNDYDRQRINEALNKCVIFKQTTGRIIDITINRHSGLNVYINQESLPYLNTAHDETEWAKAVK